MAAAWLALVLGLTMGLGSCTAVLNLDGYGNVADEMCSLLDRCYPKSDTVGCLRILEKNLDGATLDARAEWLDSFTRFNCLESCSAGRHCLNVPPLCALAGACVRRQDCCGFLDGNATCHDKTCCQTRGSKCNDGAPCCPGAGACTEGICGKIACLASSTDPPPACTADAQCCTRICKRGKCARTICEDNNAACGEDTDCCSHFCDPTSKLCGEPPKCGAVDTKCTLNTDCCVGTSCVIEAELLEGTCQVSTCSFALVDCSADDQCCSGRCDRLSFFCVPACVHEGSMCAGEADCCSGHCTAGFCTGTCSTTSCTQPSDCCGKACVNNVCAAACEPPSNHTPFTVGGPLGLTATHDGCVDKVCVEDSYCCCGGWDELCVVAAAKLQDIDPALCQ